jgi:predicted aspartyl protease
VSPPFNQRHGLIVVRARLSGPSRTLALRLALDTGANNTLISTRFLVALGYKPAAASKRVRITTASGVESAPRVRVSKIAALGVKREGFPVLAHTLPPSASIDGLLGLDFLRGHVLTIDFRKGRLDLSS